MRIYNIIVLMTESIIVSDEPINHDALIVKHGIELVDVLVTGRINRHGISFRSCYALDRGEITEEYLLKVQGRVRDDLKYLALSLENRPEHDPIPREKPIGKFKLDAPF